MKKLIVPMVLAFQLAAATAAQAAQVERVIVRQQWPWSADIKVEYRLADVTTPVDVEVHAYDGAQEFDQAKLAAATRGDRFGLRKGGLYELTIDPAKAFGAQRVAVDRLRVQLQLKDSPAETAEILYKVINLDQTPVTVTDISRADFYNGRIDPQYAAYTTNFRAFGHYTVNPPFDVFIWTGITNGPLYRTKKIALRKIKAAGQSFRMGEYEAADTPPESSKKRDVSFTKDYWMGVFEITQAQLRRLKPDYVAWETNELYAATRAASRVSWLYARGTSGKSWPAGDHSNVSKDSFMYALQQATGNKRFDLPTSAQWEFAARAGAQYKFPSHTQGTLWYFYEGNFIWRGNKDYRPSEAERNCDLSMGAYVPGSCDPNAWGLYDVMGNVWEHVLDRAGSPAAAGEDPRGPEADTSSRVCRGGGYGYNITDLGGVWSREWHWDTQDLGFRLCLHEED